MDHKQEQTIHNEIQNLSYWIIRKYDKRAKKENILHLLKQFNLRVLNYVDVSIKIILWIWKQDSTSRKDEQLSSSEKEQSRKKTLLF